MKKRVLAIILLSITVLGMCASIYFLFFVSNPKTEEVVEQTAYFKITYADSGYYYYIYNGKQKIVKSEGPLSKRPDIILISHDLLQITIQTGTGIATQWGCFYDVKQNTFSRIFQSIYDQSNRKVAYGALNKIVVTDIFDNQSYYKEFSVFRKNFSEVAAPIIDANFTVDGKRIEVQYLSGENYEVVTEVFEL